MGLRTILLKYKIWVTAIWFIRYKLKNPNIIFGRKPIFNGIPLLAINSKSYVRFGDNVIFNNSTKNNFAGINKQCSIAVIDAILIVGDNSGFSGVTIFCSKKIIIGDFVNIGVNVFIWDTDFHPLDFRERRITCNGAKSAEIKIGDDVFIGGNSIILKGVNIGERSIVAAGSIVSKSIPPDEIWGGNPASFIKSVFSNR